MTAAAGRGGGSAAGGAAGVPAAGHRSDLSGLYDDPAVYDILHGPGTAAELDALERADRLYGRGRVADPRRRPPLWLEPACGTARLLRLAAARGRRVIGFDREPAMLAYARERLRRRGLQGRARLFMADLTGFADRLRPASVDFAFVTINTIRHLPADAAMRAHLEQVARVLRPGGLYVIGISLSDYAGDVPDEDAWRAARGGCLVQQLINYLPPPHGLGRRERLVSHLTVSRPGGTEHRDDTFTLRTYDEREWSALLRRAPLTRVARLDQRGRPLAGRRLAYQLEVLRRDGGAPSPRK